jgi:hypothetical protein
MKWKDKLLKKLAFDLKYDDEWRIYIEKLNSDHPVIGIHLAVFSEPILSELLAGKKTIESRFSTNRISPFGKVQSGDIVLVKKSGGPVVAVFVIGSVDSYSNLTPAKILSLRNQFSRSLGLSEEDEFWREKANSKYGTLIAIKRFREVYPYNIEKKDRTGWVVIQNREANEIFSKSK